MKKKRIEFARDFEMVRRKTTLQYAQCAHTLRARKKVTHKFINRFSVLFARKTTNKRTVWINE